jgi:hypothetical protein
MLQIGFRSVLSVASCVVRRGCGTESVKTAR